MDSYFMLRALEIAREGIGKVSPNPLVGAVIVKDGKILAEGYHQYFGGKHAEINAIESSLEPLDGSTLYCNLEPCSKIYSGKKNSPCCDAIIKSGIKRVVIAQIDPNPHVSGSGVTLLRENGIEVITGVEQEKALELNVGFNSVMSKGRPYIHIKWAQSLDGKIAASSGVSKWISSEACRKEVHFFRGIYDAILVGRNTLEMDNPQLDTRYGGINSPRPVIIDAHLKSSPELNVFKRDPVVFCSDSLDSELYKKFKCQLIKLPGYSFSINTIIREITALGINSLYIEGGSNLVTQFVQNDSWDRISIYIAPKLFGNGLSSLGDIGVTEPSNGLGFVKTTIHCIDNNIVFNGYKEVLCLQE